MTFRTRLTLAAALAVAVAVALASLAAYLVVRGQLRGQIDDALQGKAAATTFAHLEPDFRTGKVVIDLKGPHFGGPTYYVQAVDATGETALAKGESVKLPVTDRVRRLAAGRSAPFFTDAHVASTHVRIYAVRSQFGPVPVAIQVARSLTEVDHALGKIRLILILVTLGGVLLATALGLGVARAALAPVRRLTRTTEHVTETGDLTSRIEMPSRGDELSRLAGSFNTMLAALEQSVSAQRQLVADASHELRTPLTSLRTNIEVLARSRDMAPAARERLLADVVEQLAEMSALVAELVELARGETPAEEPEEIRLDLLVADAVARAERHASGIRFATALEESSVQGVRRRIERAVGNLLDNAVKWSPPGGTVTVAVQGPEVSVRDEGPGIDDADLPHVFDRFYRAPSARGLPGSGLGLAIVRQVAEDTGGDVVAERPEGGGTRMRLRLAPPAAAYGFGLCRSAFPTGRFRRTRDSGSRRLRLPELDRQLVRMHHDERLRRARQRHVELA